MTALDGQHLRPALIAVDDDADALSRIQDELSRRYEPDYRVLCERTPADALAALEAMRAAGEDVAVVLADLWMPEMTGDDLLARVRDLHPRAKRALLVEWGEWAERATAAAILHAMALGHIDYYVVKPWRSPDEFFHRTLAEFLHEWARLEPSIAKEVAVVGEQWSSRAHELRNLLARNGVPHVFYPSDSDEGRRVIERAGRDHGRIPIVALLDGRILVDPSNAELAAAYGVRTQLARHDFDVVVVGAGPAGLAAAVYASSEGLRTLVVECEAIGGQAGSSSLIRNYFGFSRGVSGAELAQGAFQQAWMFGAHFLFMRRAVTLGTDGDRHTMRMSEGSKVTARAVVLATGVTYRRLTSPTLEDLTGAGVFYGASVSEAQAVAGQHVYIVGGGNSAGQAAMHLSRYAARVTLLVRGASLAASMAQYLRDEIDAAANVEVRYHTTVAGGSGEGRLERLTLRNSRSDETSEVPAAALFVMIGAEPRTDWLPAEIHRDRWGYLLTGQDLLGEDALRARWPLERPPLPLETTLAGVFAVGDVRHRSVKRVASAVGEGSVAIQQVHEYLKGVAARPPESRGAAGGREAVASGPKRSAAAP